MRILLLAAWFLLIPVGLAYHLGPGQARKTLDQTAVELTKADELVAQNDYAAALAHYDEALKLLPADRKADGQRIRLERAKAMLLAQKLPEANADLEGLVDELTEDPSSDAKLLADARAGLASSQYYLTWLMRLEGMSRDLWEPEVESARQIYKLLAEQAQEHGDSDAAGNRQEDLEAALRLARLDLAELQGLPLPSQCKGCCSGKCKGKGKQPAKQKLEKTDIRSAGSGANPDNRGR